MSEETKDAPIIENSPVESVDNTKKFIIEDTPGDRTVCTILPILAAIFLFRVIITLFEHKMLVVDPDTEGLYMLGVTVDWFLACVFTSIAIGKSLGRLKWMFYKVTLIISLMLMAGVVVLFFYQIIN